MNDRNNLFIKSVEKSFKIIEAFQSGRRNMSNAELADLTGLGSSATQRLTYTLEKLGYLNKHPKKKGYSLALKNLTLGYNYLRSEILVELATPKIVELSRRIEQTVNLAIANGEEITYLIRIPSRTQELNALLIGRSVPAFCSSSGRVFLAERSDKEIESFLAMTPLSPLTPRTILDKKELLLVIQNVKKKGYAICSEECLLGEITIAAPIRDTLGNVAASIQLSLDVSQWDINRIEEELISPLQIVAQSISPPVGL